MNRVGGREGVGAPGVLANKAGQRPHQRGQRCGVTCLQLLASCPSWVRGAGPVGLGPWGWVRCVNGSLSFFSIPGDATCRRRFLLPWPGRQTSLIPKPPPSVSSSDQLAPGLFWDAYPFLAPLSSIPASALCADPARGAPSPLMASSICLHFSCFLTPPLHAAGPLMSIMSLEERRLPQLLPDSPARHPDVQAGPTVVSTPWLLLRQLPPGPPSPPAS